MKRDHDDDEGLSTMASLSSSTKGKGVVKGKQLYYEEQNHQQRPDAGMDELLAVLGYKVRLSDMAEVAHKLQQLQMMMEDMPPPHKDGGLSQLASDSTVHCNPSDLSGWVQTVLSGLNVSQNHPPSDFSNPIFDDNSEYDLRAIRGGAVCNQKRETESYNKRMNLSSSNHPDDGLVTPPPPPMLLVDSQSQEQEAGVRLVHTLMACADAIQQNNLKLADALMKPIGILAVSQTGPMRKVATYFAEALARRIYKIYPPQKAAIETSSCADMLQMHFYETCPYLKFAHFTANQAILEAFAGSDRVHIIDFSLKQGMQWPALMQALAHRDGGPPTFRLTGIGSPQPDNTDGLQQVGSKLAQLAEIMGIQFEFHGFSTNSLADLEASIFNIRPSEWVAVNSVLELHRLLDSPSAVEKVLSFIKAMKPKIVTIVEEEANHNGASFTDRFNEALHYYSTMFDSLESSVSQQTNNNEDDVLEADLQRSGLRRVEQSGAARATESMASSDEDGGVPTGSSEFERLQTGEHVVGPVPRRRWVQCGGDGRLFDAGLAHAAANSYLRLASGHRRLVMSGEWRG